MMDNLRRRKEAETNFCNLVGSYKIINEQDVVARKSKGVKYTPSKLYEKAIKGTIARYKESIFGADSPICIKFLDELRKQQVIGK